LAARRLAFRAEARSARLVALAVAGEVACGVAARAARPGMAPGARPCALLVVCRAGLWGYEIPRNPGDTTGSPGLGARGSFVVLRGRALLARLLRKPDG